MKVSTKITVMYSCLCKRHMHYFTAEYNRRSGSYLFSITENCSVNLKKTATILVPAYSVDRIIAVLNGKYPTNSVTYFEQGVQIPGFIYVMSSGIHIRNQKTQFKSGKKFFRELSKVYIDIPENSIALQLAAKLQLLRDEII